MLEPHERQGILRLIRSERRPSGESLRTAAMYCAQVLAAVGVLLVAYRYFHAQSVMWALVSAVLVIQPAFEQSIAASVVRVLANTVAGLVGILMARFFGDGVWQMLVALVIVVLVCERLRLDLGLRTACVSLIIIMLSHPNEVMSSGTQRLGSVVVGCVTALIVQLLAEALRRRFKWASSNAPPSAASSNSTPSAASSTQK